MKFPIPRPFDLVCVSHLRWKFVIQRPQHLMTRFARERRVFFIEEPEFSAVPQDVMRVEAIDGITLATPILTEGPNPRALEDRVRTVLNSLLQDHEISDYVLWYYTPMALEFTRHLNPKAIVWDCMDELSAFAFAPPTLLEREAELLRRAQVVFTGGESLFEAKQHRHPNVHAFPSSIDAPHFAQARTPQPEPADQAAIPHPRIGFFGVVDERFDVALLAESARLRPDWHWVIIGPVVKIDPKTLPHAPNINYLGKKDYAQLPTYLSGWDAAILPFARNESTKFISPTKTPEYLAAGRPVVSTSIKDVIRPYAEKDLVQIADTAPEFVQKLELAMANRAPQWLAAVDQHLKGNSWDRTYQRMLALIQAALIMKGTRTASPTPVPAT